MTGKYLGKEDLLQSLFITFCRLERKRPACAPSIWVDFSIIRLLLRLFQDSDAIQLLVINFFHRSLQVFLAWSKHMVHYSDGNDPSFSVVSHGADTADKVIVDFQHVVNHKSTYAGPYH